MKLTKLGHSCVLVETEDRIGLFDPGVWAETNLIDQIKHIDRVIYTHEHSDHFDIEILKKLVNKFPEIHVICNKKIKQLIVDSRLMVTVREQSNCCVPFISPHERLPLPNSTAPHQSGYHFKGVFSHPGDSQSFNETKEVLAMPFIGPWGKTGDSIAKVLELEPKYVLPIHDWHYTVEAREWLQALLANAFEGKGINLLPNKIGQVIEI